MGIRVSRRVVVGAVLAAPVVLRAQPGSVRIGLIHPVTGPLAYGGQLCRTGGQVAVEDVNGWGVGGAKLEAVLGDAQSKPEIGLLIGVTESLGGLYLGESLGPICVPLVFLLVLLVRPTGLFGARV